MRGIDTPNRRRRLIASCCRHSHLATATAVSPLLLSAPSSRSLCSYAVSALSHSSTIASSQLVSINCCSRSPRCPGPPSFARPTLFVPASLQRSLATSASTATPHTVDDIERKDSASEQQQSHSESAASGESGSSSSTAENGGDEAGSASSPSVPPASGRHALLGGLVVLGVLGGALWVVYERGWVSDYMANSLLSDLATHGPSSVVDLNGPGDKWQLIHVNATLRRKCAQPQYIDRLLEGLAPTEHIVEVQRMCLVILSELAHDRQ